MNTIVAHKLPSPVENIWTVDKNTDLVFSTFDDDETGKGWYIQVYPGGKCSQLFATDYLALKAFKEQKLTFSK